jgi:dTDP-4-dehydrorhamnose reductase
MENETILITGASSYVGAEIYVFLKKHLDNYKVLGTYNSNKLFPDLLKLDVTKENSVKGLIEKEKPKFIIHVAANPSSGWCDKNPELAKELNVNSTKFIVDSANEVGSKLIFISSFAAINPTTFYGETKLESEEITKKCNSGYLILRPSLIVGYSPNITNDRPFNRILKNITEGKPAIYDNSWKFQPTYLRHLCNVIKSSIEKEIYGETIPVAIPELKTRFEIGKDILEKFDILVKEDENKSNDSIFEEDLTILDKLGLPTQDYPSMIEEIVQIINSQMERGTIKKFKQTPVKQKTQCKSCWKEITLEDLTCKHCGADLTKPDSKRVTISVTETINVKDELRIKGKDASGKEVFKIRKDSDGKEHRIDSEQGKKVKHSVSDKDGNLIHEDYKRERN